MKDPRIKELEYRCEVLEQALVFEETVESERGGQNELSRPDEGMSEAQAEHLRVRTEQLEARQAEKDGEKKVVVLDQFRKK